MRRDVYSTSTYRAPAHSLPLAFPSAIVVLLCAALALRLALIPLTTGSDFRAFARLATLTLHGHDVYAMSRAHLHTAPWTYFPLCLDMFTLLKWLALHSGVPFRVLGKLPIALADLAVGYLIYRALRRRGQSERLAAAGMALYLFNPFVLYNGAFYGRFDAIALAFLLLVLESSRTRWFALSYALAIAAKTFPLFLAPLLALGRERQPFGRLAATGALVLLLALPYLAIDPGGLLHKMFYHLHGTSLGRLSWYMLPVDRHWLSRRQVLVLARVGMLLYPVLLLVVMHRPLYVKAAACFALFVAVDQTVYEQYLLWALPFLIIVGMQRCGRLALWLVGLFTVAGLLENEQTWGASSFLHYALLPTPAPLLNAALAASILAFVGTQVLRSRDRVTAPLVQDRAA